MATNLELSNLTNGIVSYWKFDGNSNDAVGTNNGTDTFVTYTNGRVGSGASFNGSSSYIRIPQIDSNLITISCWVYLNSNANQVVIRQGKIPVNFDLRIISNSWSTFLYGTVNGFTYDTGVAPALNVWQHLVCVFDWANSTFKLYINAVLVSTLNISASGSYVFDNTTNPYNYTDIGRNVDNANSYLDGVVDEFGIWKIEKTAQEISLLYNNGVGLSFPFQKIITPKRVLRFNNTTLSNGLVSYWKMDGDTNDSVGSNNGTGTTITYDVGKIGQASTFPSNTSKININTLTTTASDTRTWSVWFKLDKIPVVLFTGDVAASGYLAAIQPTYQYCDDHFTTLTFNHNFYLNTWHNLILTFNSGVVRSYLDGVESSTGQLSMHPSGYFNTQIFGGYDPTVFYMDGQMDEIGAWNRVLSQAEIAQIYNMGNGYQYPFPRMLASNLPILKSTLENGVVAYWKLDGNANDYLNLSHGTGTSVTYQSGKISESAYFNGSARILISDTSAFTFGSNDFSVSCWIKSSGGGNWIYGQDDIGGGNANCGIFGYQTSGRYAFGFCYGSSAVGVIGNININDNNWHHILTIRSGNTFSNYIDGVYDTGFTSSQSVNNSTYQFGIGSLGEYTGQYFVGNIDEFGIWHKALSLEEVYKLYNNGSGFQYPFHNILSKGYNVKKQQLNSDLVAYWKFDGNSNDSFSGSNGADTGVSYVDGKIKQSVKFNGINSYINYGNIFSFGTTPFSVSFWIKTTQVNGAEIITKCNSSGQGWLCVMRTTGVVVFAISDLSGGGTIYRVRDSSISINDGYWHHVVAVRFGVSDTPSIYIDGVLRDGVSQTNGTITDITTTSDLMFGNSPLSSFSFLDGEVDESGLWGRALSADDVLELYNKGRGIPFPFIQNVSDVFNDLVSYHKFDGNSNDSIGNNHGTDNSVTYQNGKVNLGSTFNGSAYIDDIGTVSTYSFMQNTGVFTLNFWAKFNNYTVRPQYFMGSSPTTVQKGFYVGMGASGNFEFTLLNGISSQFIYIIGVPGVITDNEWHMYTLVGNGINCQLYKDSYLATSVNKQDSFSSGDSYDTLNFGRINNYGLEYFQGTMDEVGIWDRSLTVSEIQTLYNNNVGLTYNYGKVLTTKKLLLDNYPGALVGYSLRRLSDKYNGPCVRIRRSSDNAQQDFGFSNDYLDTAAFASFVGSGIGYIDVWYDQSGNGIDVSQPSATLQPYIRLNVLNGKAVVEFVQNTGSPANSFLGSTNSLIDSNLSGILKESSLFLPHRKTSNISFNTPFILNHPPNSYFSYSQAWIIDLIAINERTDAGVSISKTFSTNFSNWTLVSSFYNTHIDGYINGVSSGAPLARISSQVTLSQLAVGGGSPSYCFEGQMLECVLYASDKTNLRSQIEENINEYYRLY